jgi:hypothetical protein
MRIIVNNELENMWKKVATAELEILFRHLPGGTKENHEKHHLGRVVCGTS